MSESKQIASIVFRCESTSDLNTIIDLIDELEETLCVRLESQKVVFVRHGIIRDVETNEIVTIRFDQKTDSWNVIHVLPNYSGNDEYDRKNALKCLIEEILYSFSST